MNKVINRLQTVQYLNNTRVFFFFLVKRFRGFLYILGARQWRNVVHHAPGPHSQR